jgi:uncharacterized protein (TIGR02646 family)
MGRIRPDESGMKIEHWRCQDRYPTQQLDYDNLLGVCPGTKGPRQSDRHCDTQKANLDLCINPAAYDVERIIHYIGDGTIRSDDLDLDRDIDQVLNLNQARLVENRKAVLDSFKDKLARIGDLREHAILRMIDQWSQPAPHLEPYCMVVVYWLRKRLRRTRHGTN